jgi:glycosyltransferase involved in cell wall biosynthesis
MVDKLLFLDPNEEIIILDNGSTYEPLLDWYRSISNKVDVRMGSNEGHLALWATGLHKELGSHFVYTDSDIELNEDFPVRWKQIMMSVLNRNSEYKKVALALEIDDLPDHYRYKQQVLRNEGRWWLHERENMVYVADTDTTFALYKNFGDNCYTSLRIAYYNMIAKHSTWYINLEDLSEEENYYIQNCKEHYTQYTKQHKNPLKFTDI